MWEMEERVNNAETKISDLEKIIYWMASDVKNILKNLEITANMQEKVFRQEERQKVNEVRIKELEINLSKVNEKIYIWIWVISVLSFIVPIILSKFFK